MKIFSVPNKARVWASVAACAATLIAGNSAHADHSWNGYAWAYNGTPLDIPVVDNTGPGWTAHVDEAVADWNRSTVIAAPSTRSNNSSCSMATGTIQVCSDDYGDVGWLGLATIALSSGEIVAGSTKLNDHFFNQDRYNTYSWRQLVTCQEIGHDYGLAHQNENFSTDETTSCMEYTSWPQDNEHPDMHDYDQLLAIYQGGPTDGGDGGGTGGGKGGGKGGGNGGGKGGGKGKKDRVALPAVGNTPAAWGRPIDYLPNGKPHIFQKESAGLKFVTHVTWAPDEGGGDHHH